MAYNLVVSYDLFKAGQDYTSLTKAIQALGTAKKIHLSLWFVKSIIPEEEASKRLRATMDSNDSLFVGNLSTNNASWYNVNLETSKFMQENWYK